jgi:hypothetical protein
MKQVQSTASKCYSVIPENGRDRTVTWTRVTGATQKALLTAHLENHPIEGIESNAI